MNNESSVCNEIRIFDTWTFHFSMKFTAPLLLSFLTLKLIKIVRLIIELNYKNTSKSKTVQSTYVPSQMSLLFIYVTQKCTPFNPFIESCKKYTHFFLNFFYKRRKKMYQNQLIKYENKLSLYKIDLPKIFFFFQILLVDYYKI